MAPGKEPGNERTVKMLVLKRIPHLLHLLASEVAGAGPCLLVLPKNVRFLGSGQMHGQRWERPGRRQREGEVECGEVFARAGGTDQVAPTCDQGGDLRVA